MTHITHITHDPDYYEVTYAGLTIKRIRLYKGSSQMERAIRWEDLPVEVKREVIQAINNSANSNAEETQPI